MLNEIQFSVLETKSGSTYLANEILIYLFSFSSRKLHKNYHMSGKINTHFCLMLSVSESFHQTVKYGWQKNHILQDLTGLET